MGHALSARVCRLENWLRARQFSNQLGLERISADPAQILTHAGLQPDAWQEELLRRPAQHALLLCCRQAGKSTAAAALAVRSVLLQPKALVLVLSPSLRQSAELFRKARELLAATGPPIAVTAESSLRLELTNGARIQSLPGKEGTIRGFSGATLLLIDEAARVADELYYAVRPMLAVSGGTLVALSTPLGRRGWFYQEWSGTDPWQRVQITAPECPRISAAFLEAERRALGERWFAQEYLCEFHATVNSVFAPEDIEAAFSGDAELWDVLW